MAAEETDALFEDLVEQVLPGVSRALNIAGKRMTTIS